ncbi:hypothetical protein AVEN_70501-1, partial [Araneus ventricosus]
MAEERQHIFTRIELTLLPFGKRKSTSFWKDLEFKSADMKGTDFDENS